MKKIVAFFLAVMMTASVTACGSSSTTSSTAPAASTAESKAESQAASTAAKSDFKIAMVTDTGGVNDQSFNQSSWEGLQKLSKDLGVTVKYTESK